MILRILREREPARISAILAGILFLLFFPFLTGQQTLLSSSQDVQSIYPYGAVGVTNTRMQKVIDAGTSGWFVEPMWPIERQDYLAEHTAPLWNPYMSYGTPVAADMETQPFYPLTFPMVLAPNALTYAWWIVARLFLAGLFAFMWLRLFVPFAAAAAGAIAFMLNGYFIFFYGLPHLSVELLLPFGFYAAELLFRRRDAFATGLFALAVALMMLGGMPESQVLDVSLVYAYWIVRVAGARERLAVWGRLALRYAGATVLGFTGAAVMLLPLAEFTAIASSVHRPGTGLQGEHLSPAAIAYFIPLIFGPVRNSILQGYAGEVGIHGYLGIVAPLFALVAAAYTVQAAFRRRIGAREQVELFFVAALTFLILKQYGSPLANWLGRLPVYGLLVFWKYDQALISWCVAALCGFGVAHVMEGAARRTAAAVFAFAFALLTLVFVALDGPVRALAVHADYFYGALLFAIVLLLAAAAVTLAPLLRSARFERLARPNVAGGIVCALVALDLSLNYVVPVFYFATAEPRANVSPYAGSPYIRFLQEKTAGSQERVYGQDAFLYPNWSGVFGLSDVRGLDGLFYRKYLTFVKAFFPPVAPMVLTDRFTGDEGLPIEAPAGRRWLALSSIAYVVTGTTKLDGFPADFENVYDADARIYRVKHTLPRAALFYHATAAPDDAAALDALRAPSTDIFKRAVVTGTGDAVASAVGALAGNRDAGAATPATIVAYRSQRAEITADAARPALLVLTDSDFPGWTVSVDGRPAPLLTADYWFRGVLLAPGRHTVVFRYAPRSFAFGLLLSALAFLAIVALLGWEPLQARLRRRAASVRFAG